MIPFLGPSPRSPPVGVFYCDKRGEGVGVGVREARPAPPLARSGAYRLDICPPCNLCNVKKIKEFFLLLKAKKIKIPPVHVERR
jgi:hypothetical protein